MFGTGTCLSGGAITDDVMKQIEIELEEEIVYVCGYCHSYFESKEKLIKHTNKEHFRN